jgi:hypothetical protein
MQEAVVVVQIPQAQVARVVVVLVGVKQVE